MHLRFSLLDPAVGSLIDVGVNAPRGTRFATVSRGLRGALPGSPGTPDRNGWYVGRLAVPGDAMLGTAPLVDGAVLVWGSPGSPEPPGRTGLLELRVVAGPDCGAVHRLGPGEHSIGRAASANVRIDDEDCSRLHATLTLQAAGARIRDLGSTNGTAVDGQPVGRQGAPLVPGALIRIGTSVLCLALPALVPGAVRADGEGHVLFNRPPRLEPARPQPVLTLPTPPHERESARFPLVAVLVPLALGGVLALLIDPRFALFVLLSPVLLLATWSSDRRSGRKGSAHSRAEYERARRAVLERAADAVRAEVTRRRTGAPDAAELLLLAEGPRPRLWERRRGAPDFLDLRLGTADLPAEVVLRPPGGGDEPPPQLSADFVPLVVSLRTAGVVGVAGERARLDAAARHLLAQLATLHSPRDLELVLLVAAPSPGAPDRCSRWRWARWLPHLMPLTGQDAEVLVAVDDRQLAARVAELLSLLDARTSAQDSGRTMWTGRTSVLVLDGARALRTNPGVARLLAEGPRMGIFAICLESDPVALPAECAATAVLAGSGVRLSVHGAGSTAGTVDLVSAPWAHRLARALAPIRDATPEEGDTSLPGSASLVDLLGPVATDPDRLAASWRYARGCTRVIVGVTSEGPWSLDLATDGPHALIAGTTGAGKSELLQTLVASLAVANRPDTMSFVLVDYKGGSAFADCARLPHTVGMVTDLDAHLTERALASLRAELRRRERLLRDHASKDLDDYLARAGPGTAVGGPALPRLVLVVDEFATLAEELPDFVGGLVSIAARGRSLGVHMILATQRPAGVVSADIRANTGLRIALRVSDPGESIDVIDVKHAAFIARGAPGRAFARTGTGIAIEFQAARIAGHAAPGRAADAVSDSDSDSDTDSDTHICPAPWAQAGDAVPLAPLGSRTATPTDLCRLVDAAAAAANALAIAAVPSPWLPPLPALVLLADLDEAGPRGMPDPLGALDEQSRWVLPLGMSDHPAEQRRTLWTLDLAHGGNLLVAGGPRSGRSTVLRTVAGAIARRFEAYEVHVHGIDGGSGALLPLAGLPQCGTIVARDQTGRGDRLISRLQAEVLRRQELLARGGFASVAEQRAATRAGQRLPWIVLLVDGWDGVVAAYDTVDHGRPVDALLRLVREGGPAGLRVIVTGDRSALTGRLGSLIGDRLLMRFADPGDFALAGVPARSVPGTLPPGRGLSSDGLAPTQVGMLDADPSGPAQLAALTRLAAVASGRTAGLPRAQRPMRVELLPDRVSAATLIDATTTDPASDPAAHRAGSDPACKGATDTSGERRSGPGSLWALIGVGGDELDAVGIDLDEDGPGFVVAGPPGSGRSTTLCTMAGSLAGRGVEVALVTPRRSPLRGLAGSRHVLGPFGTHEVLELRAALESDAPLVVIVDDVDGVADSPMEAVLCTLLSTAGDPVRALVLAGSAADMVAAYRGVTVEARRTRSGLLLCPTGGVEGELLGPRVGRLDAVRPGRGVLVVRGRATPVQVAS